MGTASVGWAVALLMGKIVAAVDVTRVEASVSGGLDGAAGTGSGGGGPAAFFVCLFVFTEGGQYQSTAQCGIPRDRRGRGGVRHLYIKSCRKVSMGIAET